MAFSKGSYNGDSCTNGVHFKRQMLLYQSHTNLELNIKIHLLLKYELKINPIHTLLDSATQSERRSALIVSSCIGALRVRRSALLHRVTHSCLYDATRFYIK